MIYTAIEAVGEKCTGCEVCVQSCPFEAISMQYNREGFLYPIINRKLCKQCGVCIKKCPLINLEKLKKEKLPDRTLAGSYKSEDILMSSASGGAFSAIVEAIQPDIVYGASWWKKDEVSIIPAEKENIHRLRKSKYIQARIGDAYKKVSCDIKEGRKVVFSGTPCQIGGLYAFIGNRPENLYTVELVCHGIGSPGLFKRYIKKQEEDLKDEITEFHFREKNRTTGGWIFYTTIITKKGKKKITSYDPFTQLFLARIIVRRSCENCPYASDEHLADFIIGDYWGCKEHNPELFHKYGVSVIMFMNEKAIELKNVIKLYFKGDDVNTVHVVAHNDSLIRPQKMNPLRDKFFEDLEDEDIRTVIKRYLPKMSWKRKVFGVYDFFVRKIL